MDYCKDIIELFVLLKQRIESSRSFESNLLKQAKAGGVFYPEPFEELEPLKADGCEAFGLYLL